MHLARNLREFGVAPVGGTGGESVNSARYSLIEFTESIRAGEKHYPLF